MIKPCTGIVDPEAEMPGLQYVESRLFSMKKTWQL